MKHTFQWWTDNLYQSMCETRPSVAPDAGSNAPVFAEEEGIFVGLTHDALDPAAIMNKVRSPKAGAIVLFAGTIRLDLYGLEI